MNHVMYQRIIYPLTRHKNTKIGLDRERSLMTCDFRGSKMTPKIGRYRVKIVSNGRLGGQKSSDVIYGRSFMDHSYIT